MRWLLPCLLVIAVAGCTSRVKVQVNDVYPGRTVRQILAHADSASVRKALQYVPGGKVRPVGLAARNAMVKAMLHLRKDSIGRSHCLCGGFGFGSKPKLIYDVSFQVKSAKYGTLTLETEYGCPVVPRLVVAPAGGKPETRKVMGGDSLQALHHVYQGAFPDAPPAASGGCG